MTTLKEGDKAPDFQSKDQDGNEVQLSDYKGKKLVLFFILKPVLLAVRPKPAI